MTPFRTLDAIAAPYLVANVDTDKIIPARFLKTVSKGGLGRALFNDLRFDGDGRPRPDFILNQAPWDRAGILVAGENFGCGSSREHAPWALADFGIRCVIAPSFADIFFNNCFKNGILPIAMSTTQVGLAAMLAAVPATATFSVNLPERIVELPGFAPLHFEVDPERAAMLLDGRDDIDLSLEHLDEIGLFEQAHETQQPWLPSIAIGFALA